MKPAHFVPPQPIDSIALIDEPYAETKIASIESEVSETKRSSDHLMRCLTVRKSSSNVWGEVNENAYTLGRKQKNASPNIEKILGATVYPIYRAILWFGMSVL